MNENLQELLTNLPAYLGGHVLLSTTALLAAVAVSLPLGVAVSRRPKLAEYALASAGAIQTVPSLALLALMMLLLGGTIGFWPAFFALLLYSILPVLSNTVVALRGVDPALIEAARGLGMSARQVLWRVELPLAAPVILGGVRTAAVMAVGTATLATPVGGVSLGNYIFAGFATLNHTSTLFGCAAAAVLAVALDQLVRLFEVAIRRRSRSLACAACAALVVLVAGALYEPISRLFGGSSHAAVASAAFNEQYILSHAMSEHLEQAGFRSERRQGMGYGVQHLALQRGEVDCMVAYTGDVWTLLMKRQDTVDRETTLNEVSRFIEGEFGAVCLGPLGFENRFAIAVTQQRAIGSGVKTIADLADFTRTKLRRPLKIGADTGFFHQKEWRRLKDAYRLRDEDVLAVAMDPTLMYGAVSEGTVDAIVAFSSDGRIKERELVLLRDSAQVFPPYDAILLVSRDAAGRPGFVDALRPLVGAIKQDRMQEANRRVDVEKQSPATVARWLLSARSNSLAP